MALLTYIQNQWDRVLAWALVGLGALAIVLGWIGVTGTPYTFEMIPYVLSGGIGGLFLLGVGAMLWISADLRDEWRTLRELVDHQAMVEPQPGAEEEPPSAPALAATRNGSDRPIRVSR